MVEGLEEATEQQAGCRVSNDHFIKHYGSAVEHLQLQLTISAMPVPSCGTSALHIFLALHACVTHACFAPPHAAPFTASASTLRK